MFRLALLVHVFSFFLANTVANQDLVSVHHLFEPDSEGNRIPDFSHAGYGGGGVSLPIVSEALRIGPIDGDNTAHLQSAIDAISSLPLNSQGFRGALQLLPGTYQIKGSLYIRSSGLVLRGSGSDQNPSIDTIIHRIGNETADVIQVGIGEDHKFSKRVNGTETNITTDVVYIGDRSFDVQDASGYRVGDHIVVNHPCTLEWLSAVDFGGTDVDAPWEVDSQPLLFRRIITEINGTRITVDAPIFNTLNRTLSQSYIARADRTRVLERVGIEYLSVTIDTKNALSSNNTKYSIVYTETENCWVRDVSTRFFAKSGIVLKTSVHCTVENSRAVEPHSPISGGYRYNFCVEHSQLILFDDCFADNARHAYIGNGASLDSGIVFLNCKANESLGSSEPHRRWGMGFLYDGLVQKYNQEVGDVLLLLGNRGSWGTGHGWSAANSVAWNCDVGSNGTIVVQKPPTAQNYAIGCRGGSVTGSGLFYDAPGRIELTGSTALYPQSLYLYQLQQRLSTFVSV